MYTVLLYVLLNTYIYMFLISKSLELFYPVWRCTAVIVKVRGSGNSAPLLKIGNRTGQFGTVSPLPCLFFYFLAPDLLTAQTFFYTASITHVCLKVHKHDIFFYFFCRNRNFMVPRACNTRFLKIVFDSAEILEF
jgi:hypothetical protein